MRGCARRLISKKNQGRWEPALTPYEKEGCEPRTTLCLDYMYLCLGWVGEIIRLRQVARIAPKAAPGRSLFFLPLV